MSSSVNELAYFYTSFQVIKKTLESLSFDYIPYDKKEIMLIECDTDLVERMEKELIKFRFNLQIKSHNKSKSRSSSVREVKKRGVSPDNLNSKHKVANQSGSEKKHKFSLCSNGSLEYGDEEINMYKKLLKQRYKV
jgi:hypothetical protein